MCGRVTLVSFFNSSGMLSQIRLLKMILSYLLDLTNLRRSLIVLKGNALMFVSGLQYQLPVQARSARLNDG